MEMTYRQPYRMPAAALAMLVHALFFALLYFGVGWRSEQPQGMTVDIWESMPVKEMAPSEPPPPKPEPAPPEPPKPVVKEVAPAKPAPVKAEIELKDKKKPEEKKLEVKQPVEVVKPTPPKLTETMKAEQAAKAEMERIRAERAAADAARAAQNAQVVNEFVAKIISKVRHNIVMPPDVPDSAKAEFDVTLLPGGSVLNTRLVKSSGNAAYDSAVERAILKSQPLPLPPDVALFNRFRELHLGFKPVE